MFDTTHASHDDYSTTDATCTAPPLRARTDEEDMAHAVEMLCGFNDKDFAIFLVGIVRAPNRFTGLTLLYAPAIKQRVANVLANEPVSEGILWPGLRTVPGFLQAAYLRALPPPTGAAAASVWDAALTAQDFCAQDDALLTPQAKDLLIPGAITLLAAPRASFKSLTALALATALATGGIFRGERLHVQRVLLVDRDNPPALVRKRLRALGAGQVTGLKVLTRDQAPPLTDKAAWAAFPVEQYDVIIVDSIGASTEGVSEKEGRQTQEFLATLKDLAHRGPAILGLDNTNKAGANIRGRGEKSDAVDIVYECRNVTGWTPTQGGAWWESLPEYGEHTWQQRATRQHGQQVLRLAFIPSKFRLGVEPEPFVLEIDTRQEPWTLAEITAEIATAGEANAQAARDQERRKLHQAAQALGTILRTSTTEPPLLKREAETFLRTHQLTARQAKNLLEQGYNRDVTPEGVWILRPIPGAQGQAIGVYPVGEGERVQKIPMGESPHTIGTPAPQVSDTRSTPSVQNIASQTPRNDTISGEPCFVHGSPSGCTKHEHGNASVYAVDNDGAMFRTPDMHENGVVAFGQMTQRALACARCQQVQMVAPTGNGYLCTVCGTVCHPAGGNHGV